MFASIASEKEKKESKLSQNIDETIFLVSFDKSQKQQSNNNKINAEDDGDEEEGSTE
jgi:hypothetical protein